MINIFLFAICMTIIIALEFYFNNKLMKVDKELSEDTKLKKDEKEAIKLKRILKKLCIIRWMVFIVYFSYFSVNKLSG